MEFESVYAMRFYELLSGQKNPLTYTIGQLKDMFKISDKYKLVSDFMRKVIEVAKKRTWKSPYSFEYKINKSGRKFHSITFIPKFQTTIPDEGFRDKDYSKKVSLRYTLTKQEINYLKENFGFLIPKLKEYGTHF